ncbi:head completion/stabilization protein [Pectobacterium carotovorum]|uniref:head completion/stabilization protein n=1 Tax=Pectobacterium carotovorum TaxID=554 RepID=UPI00208731BA|nr:head completion/stabilization protein [Pectobacterium carotovorum]GKV91744.1 phage head completion/stabilization protein [Pectobacterium carotovorum subsp. carotovorum]
MSLIATEPVRPATQDTINDGDATVTSHAFWPVIVLSALRRAMRLDGQVTTDRLMDKAIEAVAHVNGQLADWRNSQEQRGFAVLPEVKPDSADEIDQINGESVLVWRYRRAVYSITKALLIEGYRDIDTTREGEKHAEALSSQIDTLWRDGRWAIRDILGVNRGLAELV